MRCHYEVLGVDRQVEADELKKRYRKLALQCHPDKNPEDPEAAKVLFQSIQQAYEVLSDPQERAWYDAHREAILKHGGIGSGSEVEVDGVDLFAYFNSSAYRGFDDGPESFYTVYDKLFQTLNGEDQTYSDSVLNYPRFGGSQSESWHAFYDFFSAYSTPRSYSWLDQYDTRQADNRRVARLMEKENKKLRDEAKKERNQLVRELVKFIRKRDRRVQRFNQQLELKAAENARKTAELRQRHLDERASLLAEALQSQKEAGSLQMDSLESQLTAIENEYHSDQDEDNFCVACNKQFRNEKAFNSHLKQKKHSDNVQILRAILTEEEKRDLGVDDALPDQRDEAADEGECDARTDLPEPCGAHSLDSRANESPESPQASGNGIKKIPAAAKKKSRRKGAKKGVPSASTQDAPSTLAKTAAPPMSPQIDLTKTCSVCQSSFPSKNKLYQHLKSSNHAVYVG